MLWTPSAERIEAATITGYARWVAERHDVEVTSSYAALWRWSVTEPRAFWRSIWDRFDVLADGPPERVLTDERMPGATWFPDVRLSYAENLLRGHDDAQPALHHASELRALATWTWGDMRVEVARVAAGLRHLGVGPGDRVAAYLPNIPETIAAFLATVSLGAIWSSAAPEFGERSVVDRFAQIEPAVLLAVDGYRYGGRDFDRSAVVAGIAAALPGRPPVVRFGYLDGTGWPPDFGTARTAAAPLPPAGSEPADGLTFARVPFDHPLWILFSSGTTGLPKAIVHSHGGMLLEQLKHSHLHLDAQAGDRVFWFTTTGWMMWNFLVGVLLTDAEIVLFDGNPAHPDLGVLWRLAADAGITTFGTSASFLSSCLKADVRPAAAGDLSRLGAVGSTGSPLSPAGFRWVYDSLGRGTWLFSTSGGTDVCTAFVGGVPTLPVREGQLQARALGADVHAFDPAGRDLVGQVGELVITTPMPSMPVSFWNDPDGARYREAYFDVYPGVWRHGDWIEITAEASAVIHGRSDATINRGGVRMGTAEIYRAVLALDEVVDALVVDLPREDSPGWMPLFVVLADGAVLDDDLRARISARVRSDCSPRHVPDEVIAIAEVPRTLSGKTLEIPVKRILMGQPVEQVVSRESLANPAALEPFLDRAP
ncbi:MAG: acetoacetate--CoA ligase [Actinomycetota bacterium]|nr:acetoacetate--CoA ligase [Actinomycetota bacterium]